MRKVKVRPDLSLLSFLSYERYSWWLVRSYQRKGRFGGEGRVMKGIWKVDHVTGMLSPLVFNVIACLLHSLYMERLLTWNRRVGAPPFMAHGRANRIITYISCFLVLQTRGDILFHYFLVVPPLVWYFLGRFQANNWMKKSAWKRLLGLDTRPWELWWSGQVFGNCLA